MSFRVSPLLWPALAWTAPATGPLVAWKTLRFMNNRALASRRNQDRLRRARPLELPPLESVELTVLEDWETKEGYRGAAGVSYLLRTDRGSLLFDVGYGPTHGAVEHNARKLGVTLASVDALVISHLHLDHMGGLDAQRSRSVQIPPALGTPDNQPCFLPDDALAPGFDTRVMREPGLLSAGIASTGPLARSLLFFGMIEEQALLMHVRDKGLVVLTGCGHPTVQLILDMVQRLSDLPLYALGGGLHYPITTGRGGPPGIQMQMIFGTGKPLWSPIDDRDLDSAIARINQAGPGRMLLSAHDTCDHALRRMARECGAKAEVLQAGGTYLL